MIRDEVAVRETMDLAAALGRAEGDTQLLADMMRIFLDDCPRLVADIREAVTRGVPEAIEHAAHAIKGSLGNFAAYRGFDAAEKLEMAGRRRDMREVPVAFAGLEAELTRLIAEMERLLTPAI